MKKIAIVALLSAFAAAPAFAADGKNSVGINYGTDLNGVVGIQGHLLIFVLIFLSIAKEFLILRTLSLIIIFTFFTFIS